jgi:hypothetical protein
MNTTIKVRATVYPNKGVSILFDRHFEVSLDCAQCSRTDRTVIFDASSEHGRCTGREYPDGGHVFPGRIGEYSVVERNWLFRRKVECTFLLNYEYTPVIDKKCAGRHTTSFPRSGSLQFKATCPKCHEVSEGSVSTHNGPCVAMCDCGYALYTETEETLPSLVFKETPAR